MQQAGVERRRGRRVDLEAPMQIRRGGTQKPQAAAAEEVAKNISLAGVYFETDDTNSYAVNDFVTTFVSVPESKRREFPFTRLAGRSRVVRVGESAAASGGGKKRVGVALEFGDDLTALTAIPPRG